MPIQDDELLAIFLEESREHLSGIESNLLAMENAGDDLNDDLVNEVFRAAHSIKGGAGFFALTTIQELAHKIENVLDVIRSRAMAPTPDVINILLLAFDRLRELILHPEESHTQDISEFVTALVSLLASHLNPSEKATLATVKTITHPDGRVVMQVPLFDYEQAQKRYNIFLLDFDMIHDIHQQGKSPADVFKELIACGQVLECAFDVEAVGTLEADTFQHLPFLVLYATVMDQAIMRTFGLPDTRIHLLYDRDQPDAELASAPKPTPEPAPAPEAPSAVPAPPPVTPTPPASSPAATSASAPAETSLRVSLPLLETLMNLAGELVLSRNQLRAAIAQQHAQALLEASQRINLVTSELQDAIMQTRLQPIGTVLGKFPRVVRDLAEHSGKEIQLDMVGKEVALDRSLIEGLSDPLTHMVRNAVDHGIEPPEARMAAGKPRQGQVRIEARHEAGQVFVEISDDGGGIDPERVAQSAVAKGLITADRLYGMSAQEKIALIFLPGLSTKSNVSDLSGRGVGMDVVKTNLDRLGGKVEIRSELGQGTTFRIKLPLTLTIIPSLIFSLEGERFAIPQSNVVELLRIRAEAVKTRIEVIGDAEVLVLRDQLIPVARFADLLGLSTTYCDGSRDETELDRRWRLADRRSPHYPLDDAPLPPPPPARHTREVPGRRWHPDSDLEIVVVTTGTQTYALVVGAFADTEEIVVKPLGRHLQDLREYAGATVLGDGTVALILDVAGLAAKAQFAAVGDTARGRAQAEQVAAERLMDRHALLLFQNGPRERCAMPLDLVLRIEHIQATQIERIGHRRTMQYRGTALPLVALADVADIDAIEDQTEFVVIVVNVRGRDVGVLGTLPVDVTEVQAVIDTQTHRQHGIMGSTIIDNCTVLVVDLLELLGAGADPIAPPPVPPTALAAAGILLAEDSDFFRAQVQRYLEEDGHRVAAAPDGEAAWEWLCAHPDAVRLVVTDIEMPRLDGLGLTRRIRADQRFAHIPIIALTSLASEDEIDRGLAAGVTSYQIKLDRDRLLEELRRHLAVATTAV